MFEPLWWLVVGHFVSDYALQSQYMAMTKSPRVSHEPGAWFWTLSAHAFVHGGAVALATGQVVLGCSEVVVHWFLDLAKCEEWFGYHVDQILHLLCKLAWFLILIWYVK